MDELTIQTLIKAKYAGSLSDMQIYVNLAIQAAGVLFGGIVLWRISTVMHKRKIKSRNRKQFFDTPYAKGWKRK